jgi:hypothetical protein
MLHTLPCSSVAARPRSGQLRTRTLKVHAISTQERPTQAAPAKFANQLEALKSMSTARPPCTRFHRNGLAHQPYAA